jgi:hypothetical protein
MFTTQVKSGNKTASGKQEEEEVKKIIWLKKHEL